MKMPKRVITEVSVSAKVNLLTEQQMVRID